MSISDWIAIVCAALSTFVTIIIGVLQCRQSWRMEKFEYRQDKRDEERYEAKIKADATRFISYYYNDRGLIPLCAMASMYNSLFYYNRKMYREFCCLTQETQNRILQYLESDLTVDEAENFYGQCIISLQKEFDKKIGGISILYDDGKYLKRCLERYSEREVPNQTITWGKRYDLSTEQGRFFEGLRQGNQAGYQEPIITYFENFDLSDDEKVPPKRFNELKRIYRFEKSPEIEACQFVATFSQYLAYYATDFKYDSKLYRLLNEYIERFTMEDLFLQTLLDVYVYLVRPKQSSKGQADLK